MYNNNNNNVTPGVAFANGMQQTAMLGIAQNQAQSNYNQGYNQGVKEAWEIANKQIAELTKERDMADANRKGFLVEREATKTTLVKLKGQDWYNEWFKHTKTAKDKAYAQYLVGKGYKIKGFNA